MNMLIIVKYFFAVFLGEHNCFARRFDSIYVLLHIVFGRIKETVAMCQKQALRFYWSVWCCQFGKGIVGLRLSLDPCVKDCLRIPSH